MADQKEYQITSIISPLLNETGLTELVQKIKKLISDLGGALKEEKIIKKNLSYPIKKYQQAFYATLNFVLAPAEIDNLQKQLKFEESILRYMITGLKPESARPKPFDPEADALRRYGAGAAQSKMRFKKPLLQKEEIFIKPELRARPEAKVKLEELDKKLEEILSE